MFGWVHGKRWYSDSIIAAKCYIQWMQRDNSGHDCPSYFHRLKHGWYSYSWLWDPGIQPRILIYLNEHGISWNNTFAHIHLWTNLHVLFSLIVACGILNMRSLLISVELFISFFHSIFISKLLVILEYVYFGLHVLFLFKPCRIILIRWVSFFFLIRQESCSTLQMNKKCMCLANYWFG